MKTHNLNETYDAWSKTYDETPNPLIPMEEIVVRSLLRFMEFHDVLDAATGTGRHALYFAEHGKRVTAIDCNEKMLVEARKKAEQRKLKIEFRREDVGRLSFDKGSFDLVICALALAHVKDLKQPCQEFLRVLRYGGHLIISDLHPFVQAEFGPDFELEIGGKGMHFFPNYHAQVEDYLESVELAGGKIMAAIDVPAENKGEVFPLALIIWAKKPEGDQGTQ
jgi:ubiquinone/menaquinone biosynthesis C-methylase UbiE